MTLTRPPPTRLLSYTSRPHDDVVTAHHAPELQRERDQSRVSGRVTCGVVYPLESVEVERQQGIWSVMPRRGSVDTLELFVEVVPVCTGR